LPKGLLSEALGGSAQSGISVKPWPRLIALHQKVCLDRSSTARDQEGGDPMKIANAEQSIPAGSITKGG
jgi:hypothetical protein